MVEATDLRELNDIAQIWRLDTSWDWSVLVERQVGPAPFVIVKIFSQDPPQTCFVEYDHVIQTLSPD
jgi:hypothetical protein